VLGAALGKIFSAVAAPAVNGYFAECPTQHSANFFKKKITLPSAPAQTLGKVFFYFFFKGTLPSAPAQALGKVFFIFFLKITLPSVLAQALGKVFFYFF